LNEYLGLAAAGLLGLNGVLQYGLGFGLADDARRIPGAALFLPAAAVFLSASLAWALFVCVLAPLALAFLEPWLLFPLSSLVSLAVARAGRGFGAAWPEGSIASGFGGLAYGAAYFCLRLAGGFAASLVWSAAAALGFLLAASCLRAIARRGSTENVSRTLRGRPIALLAAGLLALIATAAYSSVAAAIGGAP
jgi:Na+-translocating ferredoxin:NAD+ oxidoreductase RnfA subunit